MTLIGLVFCALSLPIVLFLVKQTQVFRSNASGELIQIGDGPCIQMVNGKKAAICETIPLKLTHPFGALPSIAPSSTPSASPTSSASLTPSPSASASAVASSASCPTSAANGTELLAAIGCLKNAPGTNRKLTLPAGTIEVDKKISVPANLTLSGAGINATIIKMSATFRKKITSDGEGDDALMANDSSAGQQNIVLRDFSLQGDGQRSGNSCCYGLKLQNISDSFVINVDSSNWGIDGIYMGQRPNKPGANRVRLTGCSVNNNGRNGIALGDGSNNVIDHCQLSGNSTNELVSAIDLEPDNGNTVSANHIFGNSISGNHNNGIQILQNPNDPGGIVSGNFVCDNSFGGNAGTDFDDRGSGTSTGGCTAGNLNPPIAMKPSGSLLDWLSWLPHFIVSATGSASPSASVTSSLPSAPSGLPDDDDDSNPPPPGFAYRLAETQAQLTTAQWVSYTGSPIITNFTISKEPGPKQIWVEFRNSAGQSITDHLSAFDLLAPAPTVSGITCSLDLTSKNLKITINGSNLGSQNGTLTANASSLDIVSWSDTSVVGISKTAADSAQKYSVTIKRPDTLQSLPQTCQVNTSAVSLGARVFCRAEGQFDVSNVKISFAPLDAPTQKIEETAVIDKDGIAQGLKTKLQSGQQYLVSIDAPYSLRRNAVITVQDGTTVINAPDGKPFILPIGDIAPATPDGEINGLDRAELVKQWRILDSSASGTLTADFNRDKKVNSVDWACMKYDFNTKDDDPASTGSTYNRGVNFNTGQNSVIFTSQ